MKLECVYTPRHGVWLNIAECEFSVPDSQCLDRRTADVATLTQEINACLETPNQNDERAEWRFTTEDARIKLQRLYPKVSDD